MKLEVFVPFVTYPESNSDAFAAHAASLAAQIDARLHAVAINADIPDVSNTLSKWLLDTPALIQQAESASRQRGQHLLALLKKEADDEGVEITTATVAAPIAMLGDVAASRARYFDLSFVGWEASNATSRMTAEAVIFGSGRPTVLLPELSDIVTLDHVAIAWDGSRVAARAVADAGFLLRRVSRISVITVLDEKPLAEKDAGERLATALRERGLNAESVSVKAQDCPIAETLQQTAIEKGAGLLVMGGYGHSRIRDFVLGGATEGVLNDLSMPVLLSH
ncbi:universal stress protein [Mesorhizobium sp. ASY16-5R]|uniref:universal stress protein n=1 Tax=Mesorhizobium sp. ASY16-5R TaxID=3445772 RepID=UPI003FA0F8F9